jgi:hypothetical protein
VHWTCAAGCAATALVLATSVQAIPIIQYSVSALPVPGNYFRYDYTVTNDGSLGVPISLFDIEFDTTLYNEASLQPQSPADWTDLVLGSALGVPAAVEWEAIVAGIASGETGTGFAVEFQWLGSDLPGVQSFLIYDPDTFAVLASGSTTPRDQQPIPEPAGWLLAGTALLLAARSVRRKRTRRARGGEPR